jgi:hypothetical protein
MNAKKLTYIVSLAIGVSGFYEECENSRMIQSAYLSKQNVVNEQTIRNAREFSNNIRTSWDNIRNFIYIGLMGFGYIGLDNEYSRKKD